MLRKSLALPLDERCLMTLTLLPNAPHWDWQSVQMFRHTMHSLPTLLVWLLPTAVLSSATAAILFLRLEQQHELALGWESALMFRHTMLTLPRLTLLNHLRLSNVVQLRH
jgi:hypothetical protein